MIKKYKVTSAEVHDSKVLDKLIEEVDAHHELYGRHVKYLVS